MTWKAGTLPPSILELRFFFVYTCPTVSGIPCAKSPALQTISPFSRQPKSPNLQGTLKSVSHLMVSEEQVKDSLSLFSILQ